MVPLFKNIKIPFTKKKKGELEESFDEGNLNLQDLLSPDSIKETPTYMRMGGNYVKTLVAVNYKPILDREKILEMSEMSDNVSIVFYVQEIDSYEVQKRLSESIKQNNTKLSGRYVNASRQAELISEINSAEMQLHQLTYSSQKVFMFQMVVNLVAPSISELDNLTKKVKTRLGSYTKTLAPTEKMRDAFDSFLPLHKNKVYDLTYRPMDSEAVSYFFPFHENEYFHENGLIKGKNLATKNVVIVDDEKLLNKHQMVIGMTGVGKSTYLATDMLRKFMIGRRIIIIDPKNDYTDLVNDCGGEVIEFSFKANGNIINPFDIPNELGEVSNGGNNLYNNISMLLTLFKLMFPAMTDLQEDVLQKTILKLYEKKGINAETDVEKLKTSDYPIMRDLFDFLDEMEKTKDKDYPTLKDFHSILYAYTDGMYGKLLNGYTNVDTDNMMTSYNIHSLINDEKAQRVVYYLLLSHVKGKVLNGNKFPTQFYIDEAHLLADPKVPRSMQDLHLMMKLFRSFNCGITPATQSIKDFLSAKDDKRNYGEAIITSSVQRLYLPMQQEEIEFLQNELGNKFSKKELDRISIDSAEIEEHAGRGIYMVGGTKIEMLVELSEAEKRLWFRKGDNKVTPISGGKYA